MARRYYKRRHRRRRKPYSFRKKRYRVRTRKRSSLKRAVVATIGKIAETKRYISASSTTASTSRYLLTFQGPALGSNRDQRIGKKIFIKSLHVRYVAEQESDTGHNWLRVIWTRAFKGSNVNSAIVASNMPDGRHKLYPDEFWRNHRVLDDRLHYLAPPLESGGSNQKYQPVVDFVIPLKVHQTFTDYGDVATNEICCFLQSDSSIAPHPGIDFTVSMLYNDV